MIFPVAFACHVSKKIQIFPPFALLLPEARAFTTEARVFSDQFGVNKVLFRVTIAV